MTRILTTVTIILTLSCVSSQFAHTEKPKNAEPPQVAASKQVVLEEAGYINGLPHPMIKGAELGKGGSSVCWLYVPEAKDWVLVNLNHTTPQGYLVPGKDCVIEPGVLSYVNCYPLNPAYALPAGLFFWYNDWEAAGDPKLGDPGAFVVRTYPGKDAYLWDNTAQHYINWTTKEPYQPSDNRHPRDRAVRHWVYHHLVDLNQAFEYTMCMSEQNLREKLGMTGKQRVAKKRSSSHEIGRKAKRFNAALKTLPERAQKLFQPGFETNFKAQSVAELRGSYRSHMASNTPKNGRFFVLKKSEFDRQREGYMLDIRYLQEHVPGAAFHIVSTFGSTEKGARVYRRDLDSMNEKLTQGNAAVLGTMAGAVVRRYIVEAPDRNLLYGLRNVLVGAGDSKAPYIDGIIGDVSYDELVKTITMNNFPEQFPSNQALGLALSGAMGVGVHKNVPVTGGSWGKHDILIPLPNEPFDGPQAQRVPAFNKAVDVPVYVNQVYTAAIAINSDILRNVKARGIFEQDNFALPKAALRAAYEGTILAASSVLAPEKMAHGSPLETGRDLLKTQEPQAKLFLTLAGSGEAANDPEWIATILEQLQALMYASGLQVGLILWNDAKMAPYLDRLEAISRRIRKGNMVALSEAAEKAGELLWLFDSEGKLKPKIDKETALVVLPIKKRDESVTLPVWQIPHVSK